MSRPREDRADGTAPPVRSGGAARNTEAPSPGQARHLRAGRRFPRWVRIGTAALSVLLVGVLAFGAYWAIRLQANLTTAALGAGNTKSEGVASDSSDRMQILVLGSDTRDGKNSQYGTADDSTGYGHSDVMMLLDISADNKRVNVISFPRDLLVDIPKCKDPETGTEYQAHTNMINAAMSEAGIGCAVDTVNKLTGMETDHFMMADFNAVKELSNAVGGVEVCISDAVYDPDSRLRLPQGTSTVQGEQALSFVRTRHAFGDGGDLGRIQAQQAFLSSLTRKIKDDGTLANPPRMLAIADAITKNLTIDEGLASIPTLLTVGSRLKDIDVGKVAFVAVPTAPARLDPNRLELAEPAASQLFAALRKNIDLTDPTAEPAPDPSADPGASPEPPPAPAYDKSLQPVTVANGSGVPARTQEILQVLTDGGFTQLGQLTAGPVATTAVYYGAEYADVAADVAALLGIPAAQVLPAAGVAGVQVYLGTDFAGGIPAAPDSPEAPVELPPDIVNQTASDVVCQRANPALIVY